MVLPRKPKLVLLQPRRLQRAIVEVERRFCGNTHDHETFSEQGVAQGDVSWSDREKASAFLDMRLLLKASVMDTDTWKETKNLLQAFYVEFYVKCKIYQQCKSELSKEISRI